jgi:hypothetical protein
VVFGLLATALLVLVLVLAAATFFVADFVFCTTISLPHPMSKLEIPEPCCMA